MLIKKKIEIEVKSSNFFYVFLHTKKKELIGNWKFEKTILKMYVRFGSYLRLQDIRKLCIDLF